MARSDRDRPPRDPESFFPDRMIPVHDDRWCPHLNEAQARMAETIDPSDAADAVDEWIAGAWDGWLGFHPLGGEHGPSYWAGRRWGEQFERAGSPW